MEAVMVNIIGTNNIIEACKKYRAKLIHTSTDKVVQANSIMGATKKVAEIMVKNAGFVSVRFGNVLGSAGSLLPIIQRQLDKGEPLTVTDERCTRYMMTIPDACELLIKAADIGEPGKILVMDMGEPVNVLQLAKDILKKSGKEERITMIGLRPGETLTEVLMTQEEESTAKRVDQFWII